MICKVATGPFDDKRYLLPDGIHSLPYGHYALQAVKIIEDRVIKGLDSDESRRSCQLSRASTVMRNVFGPNDYFERPSWLEEASQFEVLMYRVMG